jgi:hypothetical protein
MIYLAVVIARAECSLSRWKAVDAFRAVDGATTVGTAVAIAAITIANTIATATTIATAITVTTALHLTIGPNETGWARAGVAVFLVRAGSTVAAG